MVTAAGICSLARDYASAVSVMSTSSFGVWVSSNVSLDGTRNFSFTEGVSPEGAFAWLVSWGAAIGVSAAFSAVYQVTFSIHFKRSTATRTASSGISSFTTNSPSGKASENAAMNAFYNIMLKQTCMQINQ